MSQAGDSRRHGRGQGTVALQIIKSAILNQEDSALPFSNLMGIDDAMSRSFSAAGAVEPPISPLVLVRLVTLSNCLRQNIDAMTNNVFGYGFRLEPTIDLNSSESWEQIKSSMIIEHGDDDEWAPTDDEVTARVNELRKRARREKALAESFFAACCSEVSFVRLCKKMGTDKESAGFAALELIRDREGHPRRLNHAPSWTMRALPRDKEPVEVEAKFRSSPFSVRAEKEFRHFRRYVQDYEGMITWFKSFGDKRVMSAETGLYYANEQELKNKESRARIATELLWFKLDTSESDLYGAPRWIGNLLSVIGSREMEEVNLMFWQHKSIPPMAVLISGGKLAAGARKKLERVIEDRIKGGKDAFHRILVIEAEPSSGVSATGAASQDRVRIEMKPLVEAIWKDQLWGGYDMSNRLKVGESFRIPPILRGDTKDFNRATADVARDFAEEQVFEPDRSEFDFEINRTIMMDLGINLWFYRTNGPRSKSPEKLVEFASKLVETSITPNEVRRVVGDILGIVVPKIDAEWANVPVRQALSGFGAEDADSLPAEGSVPGQQNPKPQEPESTEPETETIRVSQDVMDSLVHSFKAA